MTFLELNGLHLRWMPTVAEELCVRSAAANAVDVGLLSEWLRAHDAAVVTRQQATSELQPAGLLLVRSAVGSSALLGVTDQGTVSVPHVLLSLDVLTPGTNPVEAAAEKPSEIPMVRHAFLVPHDEAAVMGPALQSQASEVAQEFRQQWGGPRSLEDPEVQTLARTLRAEAVLPWPHNLEVPEHVCAVVMVRGDRVGVAHSPQHRCPNPEWMFLHAAAAVLEFYDNGPDEGWDLLPDGSYMTGMSDSWGAATDPNVVVPISELPPL